MDEGGAEIAARRQRQGPPLTIRTIATTPAGDRIEQVKASPDRRLKIAHTSVSPGGEPVVTTRVGRTETTSKEGIDWKVPSFLRRIHWPRSGL